MKKSMLMFLLIILSKNLFPQQTHIYEGKLGNGSAQYNYYENQDGERTRHGAFTYTEDRLTGGLTYNWNDRYIVLGNFNKGVMDGKFTEKHLQYQSSMFLPLYRFDPNMRIFVLDDFISSKGTKVEKEETVKCNFKNGLLDGAYQSKSVVNREGKIITTELVEANFSKSIMVGKYLHKWGNEIITGNLDSLGYKNGKWTHQEGNIVQTTVYENGCIKSSIKRNLEDGSVIHKYDNMKLSQLEFFKKLGYKIDTLSYDNYVNFTVSRSSETGNVQQTQPKITGIFVSNVLFPTKDNDEIPITLEELNNTVYFSVPHVIYKTHELIVEDYTGTEKTVDIRIQINQALKATRDRNTQFAALVDNLESEWKNAEAKYINFSSERNSRERTNPYANTTALTDSIRFYYSKDSSSIIQYREAKKEYEDFKKDNALVFVRFDNDSLKSTWKNTDSTFPIQVQINKIRCGVNAWYDIDLSRNIEISGSFTFLDKKYDFVSKKNTLVDFDNRNFRINNNDFPFMENLTISDYPFNVNLSVTDDFAILDFEKDNKIKELVLHRIGYVDSMKSEPESRNVEVAESKQNNSIPMQNLIGKYTGNFGKDRILINIEAVNNDEVKGYDEVKNNRRNLKGKVRKTENSEDYFFELSEPGDNAWDGVFIFNVSDNRARGMWTANNKKLKKQFELTREN